MSKFIQELILMKVKQLKKRDLIHYGNTYGFSLTDQEASQIIHYIQTQPLDLFSIQGRKNMLRELAAITNEQTAAKAERLFYEIVQSYGVESLFE
ncbi:DUF2624 domain-containing protein [Ornithinibacillus gellani]|uniref:DUF2624 family protein n=1 Tax=Ornithinibacillus gellani TaxID=2293253 RepID=UPI000F4AF0A0|nr:DUF2624 family protein [Ornithinibacillus gellani]TQS74560.1 DUF2624 domain-containing protein [Ornithinibacillus gellani]